LGFLAFAQAILNRLLLFEINCPKVTPVQHSVHWIGGIRSIFKHFSGFKFFLLPSRVHARSFAGNANC
jgi:hypothetical protein